MAIDSKDLRKAQLIMLDMLKEFDAICQKYNLKYWLDSGTAQEQNDIKVLSHGMMI